MPDCSRSTPPYAAVTLCFLAFVVCRPVVPASADDLRDGSFAVRLRGVVVSPRRVAFDETVTGTACRIGEFIRLDNRSMRRRFLIRFPAITPTLTRHTFSQPALWNGAEAHLNIGSDIARYWSFVFLAGSATVVERPPAGAAGTIQGSAEPMDCRSRSGWRESERQWSVSRLALF
jgi:hypothetical protein